MITGRWAKLAFGRMAMVCIFMALSAQVALAAGPGQKLFFEAYELQKAGKLKEAAARYETGLKVEPKSATAHYFLGDLYAQLGEDGKAKSHFAESLKLDPAGPQAAQAKARLTSTPAAAPAVASPTVPLSTDPTKIVLPSGLTLLDAANAMEDRLKTEDHGALLTEVSALIAKYGPYPKLVHVQAALLAEAGTTLRARDEASAHDLLPQIQQLRAVAPTNLDLLNLEALAQHFLGNYSRAKELYSQWLQSAPADHPKRKATATSLQLASQGLLPPSRRMPQLPFSLDSNLIKSIESLDAFQQAPEIRAVTTTTRSTTTGSRISVVNKTGLYERSVTPVSNGLIRLNTKITTNYADGDVHLVMSESYVALGGLLPLGFKTWTKSSDGCKHELCKGTFETAPFKTVAGPVRILGAVFPMQIGNQFTIYLGDDTTQCAVLSEVDASQLHTALSGKAFKTKCDSGTNGSKYSRIDYFLDSFGIFFSLIASLDMRTVRDNSSWLYHLPNHSQAGDDAGNLVQGAQTTFRSDVSAP